MTTIKSRCMYERARRIVALALALCLVCCAAHVARASGYTTTWNLEQIYSSADEWYADYERANELIQGHSEYRGRLGDAATLAEYTERFYMSELTRIQVRLNLYASLGNSLDPSDPVYSNMLSLLAQQTSAENQLCAYVEPELAALSYEQRVELLDSPLMSEYRYAYSWLLEEECAALSEGESALLAALEPAQGRASQIYTILANLELPAARVTMPDGTERVLDAELYAQVFYGQEYDRDFRQACRDAMDEVYGSHANTFAALLDSCASENWAMAQVSGYDSALEAALDMDGVDAQVYDMAIANARANAGEFQRYIAAHGRGLGLDSQYMYETVQSFTEYEAGTTEYGDAVEQVLSALSPLGDEYLGIVVELANGGYIDVYPSATKPVGAFTLAMGDEYLPYIMLNYTGTTDDVCALAHELGHAVYGRMSALEQSPLYESASIMTHETAAALNELIYCQARIDESASDSERLYYIDYALNLFSSAVFEQAMYAEFEEELYSTIEAGGALHAEALSDSWSALHEYYYGDAVEFGPNYRYSWAEIPHLYYNHYVYSYSVAMCCASALLDGIYGGDEAALEAYWGMLRAGSAAPTVELLTQAGADPLSQGTYDAAMRYYGGLLDEYERLIDAGVR